MSDFVEQLREVAAASLLPEDGELIAPGLAEPVEVLRDRWGVPYISAASLSDLWFAQGFITAGERLFQIDLLLRAASGRLSEVFADRTLDDDRFARTIGFHRTGETLAAGWDDDSMSMHARFREGCAAWIAQMPSLPVEYSLLDMTPSIPTDDPGAWAAAFVYLAWGLSGNWDKELLRTAIDERLGDEAVHGIGHAPDHRPEHIAMAGKPMPDARLRPGWLLPHVVPLRDHALRVLAGPERIETGWWDGGDIRRDYYLVETSLGQHAWAYCPAGDLVANDGGPGHFMLHGWFA